MKFKSKVTMAMAMIAGMGALYAGGAVAEDFYFEPGPEIISDGDANTNKVKILRTPDGTIFAVYGQEMAGNGLVWDAKKRGTRQPLDIMVKYSQDDGENWSDAINISNTASLSSAKGIIEQTGPPVLGEDGHPDLSTDIRAVDYPGDSEKPNVFNVGNDLVVTWVDKYCDSGEQRYVVYPELLGVTIPYSCTYAARLEWISAEGGFYEIWKDRLSSGLRDAKQDVVRGNPNAFVVTWQEDPLGLKLGSAEGPGDGASGAIVHHGSDIWYSYLPTSGFGTDPWSEPVRITRNTTKYNALTGRDMGTHPVGIYDHGSVGASRANLGLIGPYVIVAYEETKGSLGWDVGKVIRYHHFSYNSPPQGGEIGILISDPRENARRVRFLPQSLDNEVPLVFIFKQGDYAEGGPSDIMLRRAVGGITPDCLDPPIDVLNSRASVVEGTNPATMVDYNLHQPAINFSGTTAPGMVTGTAPDAGTGDNYLENALAHRGAMSGENILIGYSYVPDYYRFTYLDDQAPYNFYVRRSIDGGDTWSEAINLSPDLEASSGFSAREPRIVKTPSSGPTCATDPTQCQDPNVIYAAYGLQTNVYSQMEDSEDVDIYMLVSPDYGLTWSDPTPITAGDALGGMWDPAAVEDFETQIKLRPDGRESYTVWSGYDGLFNNALFRRGMYGEVEIEMAKEEPPELPEEAKKPKKIK